MSDNFFQDCLIEIGFAAIWIRDIPVFDLRGMIEEEVVGPATEIDDQVSRIPSVAQDGLGGKTFGGVAVGLQGFLRGARNVAERKEASTGRFDDVWGITAGDGFRHGAATSVTDTHKEDPDSLGEGHIGNCNVHFGERRKRKALPQRLQSEEQREHREKDEEFRVESGS